MTSEPTIKTINATLDAIEHAERAPDHPRSLARQAIKHWRSDAERQGLPIATTTDGKGAPLLDVRQVLGYEDHDRRLGRK